MSRNIRRNRDIIAMGRNRRVHAAACLIVSLAASGLLFAAPAQAQSGGASQQSTRSITVAKDKSAAFHLDYPVSEIVVSQPAMVQLVATTDHSFYIRGRELGVTNLLIYDRPHHLAQVIDVRVGQDIDALQEDITQALPGERITACNMAGGILLIGTASTAAVAARAAAIAEHYAPKAVSSSLSITADQQMLVEVRMIEADRTSLQDIGFNLSASNASGSFSASSGTTNGLESGLTPQGVISGTTKIGDVSITAKLSALEQKGVVRTLAKPDLVAMSGEEASFLAGGEFPYPVPNGLGSVTVEFREFGVKLNVTPVVEDNGEIRMKIAPEVSQLDPSHSVTISGFNLPALTISKAATTVELRDGQSFAIAGLYQRGYNTAIDSIPGLGNLPVLGQLFRSSNWQHNQTELVIIVTPHLAAPSDRFDQMPNPLAGNAPTSIDQILVGLLDKPEGPPTGAGSHARNP
jgi:pilus assembly protein CpaC